MLKRPQVAQCLWEGLKTNLEAKQTGNMTNTSFSTDSGQETTAPYTTATRERERETPCSLCLISLAFESKSGTSMAN